MTWKWGRGKEDEIADIEAKIKAAEAEADATAENCDIEGNTNAILRLLKLKTLWHMLSGEEEDIS